MPKKLLNSTNVANKLLPKTRFKEQKQILKLSRNIVFIYSSRYDKCVESRSELLHPKN